MPQYLDNNGNPIDPRRARPRPPGSVPPTADIPAYTRDPKTGKIVKTDKARDPKKEGQELQRQQRERQRREQEREKQRPQNPTPPEDLPPPQDPIEGPPPGSDTADIPPWSMDAFLDVIRQIDPNDWENDWKRFEKHFEKWGVKLQRGSSGTGAFRGRFMLPGMSGYDWDPWRNGFNWGKASYDTGPVGGAEGEDSYRTFSFREFDEAPFEFEPWTRDFSFTPPGQQEIEADPVYQQRIAAAQKAIERSAAAKGTLIGKGTLMALTRESQAIASEEGDKIYGRRLGEALNDYSMDREAYLDRQDQRLSEYGMRYGKYQDDFNRAMASEGFNYGVYSDDLGRALDLARLGLDAERLRWDAEDRWWENYMASPDPTPANESRSRAAAARAAGQAASGAQYGAGLSNASRAASDYLSRRRYGSSYQPRIPGYTGGPF